MHSCSTHTYRHSVSGMDKFSKRYLFWKKNVRARKRMRFRGHSRKCGEMYVCVCKLGQMYVTSMCVFMSTAYSSLLHFKQSVPPLLTLRASTYLYMYAICPSLCSTCGVGGIQSIFMCACMHMSVHVMPPEHEYRR